MALGRSLSCALACLIALPGAGEAQPAGTPPAAATVSATGQSQAIFPTPRHVEAAKGHLDLTAGIRIVAQPGDAAAGRIAGIFGQWTAGRFQPAGGAGAALHLQRAKGMAPETYQLDIGPAGARVTASDDRGLFYGLVSFWQLATASDGRSIAAQRIDDGPALGWRGAMLDSARHFQSPRYVRSFIDWMAAHKLNRLHWHLVDDQGWRIEIKAFPKLTGIGAARRPARAPGAPPLPDYRGFYTQAELRDIVAYAADRGIEIVPEIDVPGHALSAIRAYPEWGMGVPVPPGTEADWGVFPWLYNSDAATLAALETILAEVIDIFPGRTIHIGGDEAVKNQWRASAATQARIAALGLKDENALQGWMMSRLARFLEAHGRTAIGWDEILEGDVPQSVAVMSWRGIDGAIEAARKGHDAVLSPSPDLYLDHIQAQHPGDPPGRGGIISLASVLAFEPRPAELSPAERTHILGVQANIWTEHIRTEERTSFMAFPRLSALAEVAWTGHGSKDYPAFLRRLMPQLDRLRPLGLEPSSSAWTPAIAIEPAGARARVALSVQGGLPVQYSVDGGPPLPYNAPFTVDVPAEVAAWALLDGRKLGVGTTRRLTADGLQRRDSRELETCQRKVDLVLEDDFPATGRRAAFLIDILEPCWIYRGATFDRVTDIELGVGQLPFNFQVGKDRDAIHFRTPKTPAGEFEVRLDDCDGPVIATLPLAPAVSNPGVTRLTAPVAPTTGRHDLCLTYTATGPDPLWAIETVDLLQREPR
ncbi:family 20 glycosylhydrolase [Sphingopyxis indica]|uniref:family 20 glycosylhydrolase n=1 Tax=Sphingopyxis indica TaxID=436663 RepID=UPI00293904B7|nr:family 20 glycosylhydrolase [Sphingopyxis indica]WOF42249.1 family 20 glycosylhydrolase [Sphingopyxis indica]